MPEHLLAVGGPAHGQWLAWDGIARQCQTIGLELAPTFHLYRLSKPLDSTYSDRPEVDQVWISESIAPSELDRQIRFYLRIGDVVNLPKHRKSTDRERISIQSQ